MDYRSLRTMKCLFTLLLAASCLTAVGQYEVGDVGPAGGWIFYVDSLNEFDWDYLEAAPVITGAYPTMNGNFAMADTLPSYIGTGDVNTDKILINNLTYSANNQVLAVMQALTWDFGGYNDWYIPSFSELELVRTTVLDSIDLIGTYTGSAFENLTADFIWSSSTMAWGDDYEIDVMKYNSGEASDNTSQSNSGQNIRLLVIRAFSASGESMCGLGTVWDPASQTCIVAKPSDSNFDGCVQLNDLLDLLSAYGDCSVEESAWQCGDPLEYQGYDYETVQIGEQCWFAENVRYLPGVSPPSIGSEQDGLPHAYVYGWYSEDGDIDAAMSTPNYNIFGALYNFQAVTDWDLCPSGWHVPSAAEFRTLDVALGLPDEELNNIGWTGGSAEIGTALKVESGWCCGGGGTNTSGFSAKGAGGRWGDGPAPFADIGLASRWWTSTGSGGNAWHHDVASQNPGVYWKDDAPKSRGHSVRCVKDTE